ncbi:uncharacterized protein BX663DRAFT_85793 [Cokeromyces recurvatus]|uniref:uncharacterized protein n=1 Tax=Cokeromyces recurvatus TaxID=90255 RepID=UPI0022201C30|nr:uncharacterized protein BX663DRAFT_85793 [Cokeromyces recurvatus]KAI7902214.1 hypothetical protein BX663DRAFT_85793 [Cokeromyces recurvatus]
MSRASNNTKNKITLPLPFLLESNTNPSFSFVMRQNKMNESFENLNLSNPIDSHDRNPQSTTNLNSHQLTTSIKAKRQSHTLLFLIFTCPWLWHHVSPAIPILFAYLFCLTFTSMLKTSWTDPGILPRNLDIKSTQNVNQYGYRYSFMSDDDGLFPLPKEITIKNAPIQLKYCETCCIYRPPRASHCRQCDNCVGR